MFINRILGSILSSKYGWQGNYATWELALKDSTSYDSSIIVEKVKSALLKVKRGEAAFERDSVLFEKIEYNWPVLSGLLWIASQHGGKLGVLDFGGSLGSTYFQNRKFLNQLDTQWNIVEQKNFVECGKKYFEDRNLHFFLNPEECFKSTKIDVVLLSSVLPYLEKPYDILQRLIDLNPPFLIFDKMPFLNEGSKDLLTVQNVHPSIYSASYPSWFFNEKKFLDFLNPHYDLVEEFEGTDKANNIPSVFKGLIFQRKK